MNCDALASKCIADKCWECINNEYITGKWTTYDVITAEYITGKRIASKYIAGIATTVSILLTNTKSALLVSRLLVMLGLWVYC